jgi:hypothetical protein
MLSWLNNYLLEVWATLPKLPAYSFHASFFVFIALMLPPFFYGERLAEKAEKEGRVKKFMGMYTNPTVMREMFREARRGNGLARAMLWLQFLSFAGFLLFMVWPKQPASM